MACDDECELRLAESPWSKCSVACGGGRQWRVPVPLPASASARKQPPQHRFHFPAKSVCTRMVSRVCNMHACSTRSPTPGPTPAVARTTTAAPPQPTPRPTPSPKLPGTDCTVSRWGHWAQSLPCLTDSAAASVQLRSRAVLQLAANGGAECPALRDVRVMPAAAKDDAMVQRCPVDCAYSLGAWGACDRTCGGGTQRRVATVERRAANGGRRCPGAGGGPLLRVCNPAPCPASPTPAPMPKQLASPVLRVSTVALPPTPQAAAEPARIIARLHIQGALSVNGMGMNSASLACGAPRAHGAPKTSSAAAADATLDAQLQCSSGLTKSLAARARRMIAHALALAAGADNGTGRSGSQAAAEVLEAHPTGGQLTADRDAWEWGGVLLAVRLAFGGDGTVGAANVAAHNAAALLKLSSFRAFVAASLAKQGVHLGTKGRLTLGVTAFAPARAAAAHPLPRAAVARAGRPPQHQRADPASAEQRRSRAVAAATAAATTAAAAAEGSERQQWQRLMSSPSAIWVFMGFMLALPGAYYACSYLFPPLEASRASGGGGGGSDRALKRGEEGGSAVALVQRHGQRRRQNQAAVEPSAAEYSSMAATRDAQEAIWGTRAMYGAN